MKHLMDTHSLEDWYPGQPGEIWRRVQVLETFFTDKLERVRLEILDGPERGRVVTIPTPVLKACPNGR